MPVYHDEKRNTYYISASYTVRKGVYKKLVRRGFKRKKDAIRMERILMANIEDNVRKINNMSLILDDLWNDYLGYMKLTEWKEKTAVTNTSKYKKHIQPVFGQRNVLQIEKKETNKPKEEPEEKKEEPVEIQQPSVEEPVYVEPQQPAPSIPSTPQPVVPSAPAPVVPQTPENKQFLFSEGYNMEYVSGACMAYITGYTGGCYPLQNADGIYYGMEARFE